MNVFFLKSGKKEGYPFLLLHSTWYQRFSHHNKARRQVKVIQIRKEDVKLFLFANDMMLYVEKPEESIHMHTQTTKTNKSV